MKCYVHPDVDAVGTCANCGKFVCSSCAVDFNGKVTCKSCVEKLTSASPGVAANAGSVPAGSRKEPILSVILSFFFPGLGQLYNGQMKKGITMIIGYVVLWAVVIFISLAVGLVTLGFGLLCCMPAFFIPLILWAYGMYDAYKVASMINRGEPTKDWFT